MIRLRSCSQKHTTILLRSPIIARFTQVYYLVDSRFSHNFDGNYNNKNNNSNTEKHRNPHPFSDRSRPSDTVVTCQHSIPKRDFVTVCCDVTFPFPPLYTDRHVTAELLCLCLSLSQSYGQSTLGRQEHISSARVDNCAFEWASRPKHKQNKNTFCHPLTPSHLGTQTQPSSFSPTHLFPLFSQIAVVYFQLSGTSE